MSVKKTKGTPKGTKSQQLEHIINVEGSADEARALTAKQQANIIFGSKVKKPVKIAIAIAVIAALFISFFLGSYSMNPIEVVTGFVTGIQHRFELLRHYMQYGWGAPGGPELSLDQKKVDLVLFNIRGPRLLMVMLAGASLASAGASYQGMFKNPLTSPDLLGASAGASFGACLALLMDLGGAQVQLFAFIGGIAAVALTVWLNKMVDYDPTLGLVLAGILVGTLFQSGMSIIKLLADANDKLPTITFWLMGSFASINQRDLGFAVVPIAAGFILLLTQSWKLNVLSFGDEEARSMGINTQITRLIVILGATLITSATVAVAGIVGWIGLVVPHLARAIVGPNYKVLLPTAMFVGSVFLLIVDNVARLAWTAEIPIGILTSVLGVPFFVVIFRHNMRGWR